MAIIPFSKPFIHARFMLMYSSFEVICYTNVQDIFVFVGHDVNEVVVKEGHDLNNAVISNHVGRPCAMAVRNLLVSLADTRKKGCRGILIFLGRFLARSSSK